MRHLAIITVMFMLSLSLYAQQSQTTIERKGLLIGIGLGAGAISIDDSSSGEHFDEGQFGFSFPDLKIGYFLNQRTAILLNTTGMIYKYGDYDRSFEALMPSVQYWVGDRWWVNAGAGLGADMPAFYDVEDGINDDYNFGFSVGLATGYEVYRHNNFAMDVKAQTFLGCINVADGNRNLTGFSIGVGFNWY